MGGFVQLGITSACLNTYVIMIKYLKWNYVSNGIPFEPGPWQGI